MIAPNPCAADAVPTLQPILDFWTDYFTRCSEQFQAACAGNHQAADPATLRRQWLTALAESADRAMRSPAFLDAMHRHFETVTQLKQTAEDRARDLSRATGVPRLADISGLFERLQIGQDAILNRLAAIEGRLETLEGKPRRQKA